MFAKSSRQSSFPLSFHGFFSNRVSRAVVLGPCLVPFSGEAAHFSKKTLRFVFFLPPFMTHKFPRPVFCLHEAKLDFTFFALVLFEDSPGTSQLSSRPFFAFPRLYLIRLPGLNRCFGLSQFGFPFLLPHFSMSPPVKLFSKTSFSRPLFFNSCRESPYCLQFVGSYAPSTVNCVLRCLVLEFFC